MPNPLKSLRKIIRSQFKNRQRNQSSITIPSPKELRVKVKLDHNMPAYYFPLTKRILRTTAPNCLSTKTRVRSHQYLFLKAKGIRDIKSENKSSRSLLLKLRRPAMKRIRPLKRHCWLLGNRTSPLKIKSINPVPKSIKTS